MTRWALREAGTHLERALATTTHLPQTREAIEQAIDVRLDLRNAIHTLGEVKRAMAIVREAELLAGRLGDEGRIGKISLSLSNSLWMMGCSDEAQAPCDRALAIAESTDDDPLRHLARALWARLHHDRGDYRQAVAAFRESLSAFEAAGNPSVLFGATPLEMLNKTHMA